jgi:hypothetical protein
MSPERGPVPPAVAEAESALSSLGAPRPALHRRALGRSTWFADWSGPLAGSDVYVGLTGKGPAPRRVRLLLDDWIFDDVAVRDVGAVLRTIFSAGATLRRGRVLLVRPVQVLRVSVGRARYSAVRRPPRDGGLSPWERALTATGGDQQ